MRVVTPTTRLVIARRYRALSLPHIIRTGAPSARTSLNKPPSFAAAASRACATTLYCDFMSWDSPSNYFLCYGTRLAAYLHRPQVGQPRRLAVATFLAYPLLLYQFLHPLHSVGGTLQVELQHRGPEYQILMHPQCFASAVFEIFSNPPREQWQISPQLVAMFFLSFVTVTCVKASASTMSAILARNSFDTLSKHGVHCHSGTSALQRLLSL